MNIKKSLTIMPVVGMAIILAFILNSAKDIKHEQLNTNDRIAAHGYVVEQHTVQSEDGYILSITRITQSPRQRTQQLNYTAEKPIVFLQHGMFCSSDTWIIVPPELGLAYLLADAGYDVWLGNSRGNRYARKHMHLSIDSSQFWQFNLHEIGYFDLPAMLDYVLALTKQTSLHFVGDSQGSSVFVVMLSERPEYNAKIRTSHHLGPVVFMNHMRSPYRHLAKLGSDNALLGRILRNREILSNTRWWVSVCNKTCPTDSMLYPLCKASLSFFGGHWHLNQTLLPNFCQTHPAGASTNLLLHYGQLYNVGKFQRFDYGPDLNRQYYNRTSPPEYDLTKVKACISLYYGDSDLAVDGVDVEYLASILSCAKAYKVPKSNWNHFDLLWGDQVKELVNDKIIADLNDYENKRITLNLENL